MEQVLNAADAVLSKGKVVTCAVVSVFDQDEGGEVGQASGLEWIRGALETWARHGTIRIDSR